MDRWTDGPTDRRTDGPTDIVYHKRCWAHLNLSTLARAMMADLFFLQKEPILFFQPVVQIAAFAEAHGDVEKAIFAFEAVPVGDDVGVFERREEFRLLLRGLSLLRR